MALIFTESHSNAASLAIQQGRVRFAWDWLQVEGWAALRRRNAHAAYISKFKTLLEEFQFVSINARDFPTIMKLIEKHKLRSADAGHLFALLHSRKLVQEIEFVCFDDELASAARAEGVKLFQARKG